MHPPLLLLLRRSLKVNRHRVDAVRLHCARAVIGLTVT